MTFDFAKTISLIKGGLLDHEATWKNYLEKTPEWQQTAIQLTGPLILANIILSTIFSRVLGGFTYAGYYGNFFSAIFFGLIMAVIGFAIAVFVFNFMAGTFKGKSDFSRAFAAVSLAAIPAWIAGILGAVIPFIGFLIAIAGGIMSLVFMYRIMPLALAVPDNKRTFHFIASLVVIFIINLIVGGIIGAGTMGSAEYNKGYSKNSQTSHSVNGSGLVGQLERQAQIMDSAQADTFDPPADGELSNSQVKKYIKVLDKTRAIHKGYADKMQKYADEMQAKEDAGEAFSFSDLTKVYTGGSSIVAANNAEMEVVKTGDGNWAEHTWVKEQLRIAHIQQGDGSEAIAHNFSLYQKYEDQLNASD